MSNLKIATAVLVLQIAITGCVSEQTVVEGTRGGQSEVGAEQQARTRMSLGLTYLQRGENDQAIFNLEKAKELAPDMPEIWNALAYYYQQVDEFDLAEDAYRMALRKDDNSADTYNNFGAFLCQRGKFEQAEELLLAAVKRPGYIRVADSYENLAYCALEQDDFSKYKQYLLSALKHSSSRQTAVYQMATLEYAMGNLVEAKKWQTRLQNLGQVSPAASLLRYLIAYRTGDAAEQQTAEKFLVSVHPTSKETGMVLSGDFRESEPDKLRVRFKHSLMGRAQVPEVVSAPSATPKMKIVRRKNQEADATVQAMSPDVELPQERPVADLPASTDQAFNTPAPAKQAANVAAPSTEATTYAVQAGDTLYRIASRFRLSVSELQQLNQLTDASLIQEGMVLRVVKAKPAGLTSTGMPATYQVNAGDTLFSIAFKFNVSMDTLLELNQLTPGQELTPGQILKLQAGEPSSL